LSIRECKLLGHHQQAWEEFALAIKATSSRIAISFINGDPGTGNSNGLDEVQVNWLRAPRSFRARDARE